MKKSCTRRRTASKHRRRQQRLGNPDAVSDCGVELQLVLKTNADRRVNGCLGVRTKSQSFNGEVKSKAHTTKEPDFHLGAANGQPLPVAAAPSGSRSQRTILGCDVKTRMF